MAVIESVSTKLKWRLQGKVRHERGIEPDEAHFPRLATVLS
jgi:hypothetical protein